MFPAQTRSTQSSGSYKNKFPFGYDCVWLLLSRDDQKGGNA